MARAPRPLYDWRFDLSAGSLATVVPETNGGPNINLYTTAAHPLKATNSGFRGMYFDGSGLLVNNFPFPEYNDVLNEFTGFADYCGFYSDVFDFPINEYTIVMWSSTANNSSAIDAQGLLEYGTGFHKEPNVFTNGQTIPVPSEYAKYFNLSGAFRLINGDFSPRLSDGTSLTRPVADHDFSFERLQQMSVLRYRSSDLPNPRTWFSSGNVLNRDIQFSIFDANGMYFTSPLGQTDLKPNPVQSQPVVSSTIQNGSAKVLPLDETIHTAFRLWSGNVLEPNLYTRYDRIMIFSRVLTDLELAEVWSQGRNGAIGDAGSILPTISSDWNCNQLASPQTDAIGGFNMTVASSTMTGSYVNVPGGTSGAVMKTPPGTYNALQNHTWVMFIQRNDLQSGKEFWNLCDGTGFANAPIYILTDSPAWLAFAIRGGGFFQVTDPLDTYWQTGVVYMLAIRYEIRSGRPPRVWLGITKDGKNWVEKLMSRNGSFSSGPELTANYPVVAGAYWATKTQDSSTGGADMRYYRMMYTNQLLNMDDLRTIWNNGEAGALLSTNVVGLGPDTTILGEGDITNAELAQIISLQADDVAAEGNFFQRTSPQRVENFLVRPDSINQYKPYNFTNNPNFDMVTTRLGVQSFNNS